MSKSLLYCVPAISAPVLSVVGERYYKVTGEALRVCGELIRANIKVSNFDFKPYIHPIYNVILSRLTNRDQDLFQTEKKHSNCLDVLNETHNRASDQKIQIGADLGDGYTKHIFRG
ncbi:unnamed protein product [Lactuca saligna]|uniref:Uncharacterized protein n=1 Tax=Lactuca saligna TaxID=75948 RepID=A0AA35VWM7_LACSI|nr:unnamed protein product [Lactuca saligna]